MNNAFDGCVMAFPHVVDEILDRVMPAESRQAKLVIGDLRTLSSGLLSICNGLVEETEFVKITDYRNNHVAYVPLIEAVGYIRSTIRSMLGHSMVIGETASRILDQMMGYLNMMDSRKQSRPREEAAYIIAEVHGELNSRTVHHTID